MANVKMDTSELARRTVADFVIAEYREYPSTIWKRRYRKLFPHKVSSVPRISKLSDNELIVVTEFLDAVGRRIPGQVEASLKVLKKVGEKGCKDIWKEPW